MQTVGLTDNIHMLLKDKTYEMSKKYNRNINMYEVVGLLISKNIDKVEEYLIEYYGFIRR